MFSNIEEVILSNEGKGYITIPKEDYFQIYDKLSKKEAQELARIYFLSLSKKSFPKVNLVDIDDNLGIVRIELDVYENDLKAN